MHTSLLVFRNFRYLKLALLVTLVAVGLFLFHEPLGKPNGGTWLGYSLGVLSLALILWLAWFGIRKRQYGSGRMSLEGWASAHVYMGSALLVIATLHTGFEFSINVHTLAYVLMLFVIGSGFFGLYAYLRYPRLRTENRGDATLGDVWELVAGMSRECLSIGRDLNDEVFALVEEADQNTQLGGSVWRQLAGYDPNCATTKALHQIRKLAEN